MEATIHYEFERPVNWAGEIVNMEKYSGEVDYFELEVVGDVSIEIDRNYGADADGNRGICMDFSRIEDISIFLEDKRLSEDILTSSEISSIEESLFEAARESDDGC